VTLFNGTTALCRRTECRRTECRRTECRFYNIGPNVAGLNVALFECRRTECRRTECRPSMNVAL
jgi:hypothetical protein